MTSATAIAHLNVAFTIFTLAYPYWTNCKACFGRKFIPEWFFSQAI